MKFFIGSQGGTVPTMETVLSCQQHTTLFSSGLVKTKEQEDLVGDRCWTLAYPWKGKRGTYKDPHLLNVFGDSGAFSHDRESRWSFAQHLDNLFDWEADFARKMEFENWRFSIVASYDLLIDEVWVGGKRYKARWSEEDAEVAVAETVAAAQYLSEHRKSLGSRTLVLGCQGVNAQQYLRCVEQVLLCAQPGDWIGLGGWCILGLCDFKHYLFEFYRTLRLCIPLIERSPAKHVHLFGVRYEPAIAPLAWMCDRYGLTCSSDNARPVLDCRTPTPAALKRAGARCPYWRDNCWWWRDFFANIRDSRYYRQPCDELALDALMSDSFVGADARACAREIAGQINGQLCFSF